VVRVRRDFWDRVTESEEFVGRFKVASRFPQYLNNDYEPIRDGTIASLWYNGGRGFGLT